MWVIEPETYYQKHVSEADCSHQMWMAWRILEAVDHQHGSFQCIRSLLLAVCTTNKGSRSRQQVRQQVMHISLTRQPSPVGMVDPFVRRVVVAKDGSRPEGEPWSPLTSLTKPKRTDVQTKTTQGFGADRRWKCMCVCVLFCFVFCMSICTTSHRRWSNVLQIGLVWRMLH